MTASEWVAEYDPAEHRRDFPWKPMLCVHDQQLHPTFDIWFATEDDCRAWIAEHVIGAQLEAPDPE